MMKFMSELNFDEFEASSPEQWLQLLKKELGERPIDSLDWEVAEGITMGPYQSETSEEYSMPFVPVAEQYQLIAHTDAKEWNRIALESLMGGTNALGLDCSSFSPDTISTLLQGIEVSYISFHFVNMKDPAAWVKSFAELCDKHGVDKSQLNGSFEYSKSSVSYEELSVWYAQTRRVFPRYRMYTIDAASVHEQGGSIIQELSWALAAGHSALAKLMDSGVSIDEASACLQFNFAMGSDYFPQISKLRAFRWMWKRVIEAYKPLHACSVNTFIHASTSRYLQTAKDKHSNLLRSTTQVMSAFIGGANSVHAWPYNVWVEPFDESALRWARNTQQLLLEESYFSQFKTAADGSYYIEALTGKLIEGGWKQFQLLDSSPLDFGQFSKAIALHAEKQYTNVKEGKRVIVGVNRYVNKTDSAVVDERAQTLSAPFEKS